MYSIFDVHVHDIDIFRDIKRSADEVAKEMISEMNRIGITAIFLLALEVDASKVYKHVNYRLIFKDLEEIIGYGNYSIPWTLSNSLVDVKRAVDEHARLLQVAYTPTQRVLEIARYASNRILPIGSMKLPQPNDVLKARIRRMALEGVIGLKIYPTLQFINPSSPRLYPLYDALANEGMILIVHTGCDPGLWELPSLCRYGRPENVKEALQKFRDLRVILSHMGSYSAIKPGIFYREAINLINKYDNVYFDTAAVDAATLYRAVNDASPEKIFFGSDFPITSPFWLNIISEFLSLNIEGKIKRKVLGDNVRRLLRDIGKRI